jgi:putative DNA primase/helicase
VSATTATELDFAKKVGELFDAPLITCKPKPGAEFHYPIGERDNLSAADNQDQLDRWQPGWAVMARTGGSFAVHDVDERNGADIEKSRQLLAGLGARIFAEIETPSGSRHFYIAGHPELPSCSKLNGWPGIDVLSYGKLVFLPGTQRPKYGGRGYKIIFEDLEALADGGDPDGAEAYADWVAQHHGEREDFETSEPWAGGKPNVRQAAYLNAMLDGMLRDLLTPGIERNTSVYNKALKCGNFIAGAGLDEQQAINCLLDASRQNGLVQEDGERQVKASIDSGIKNGKVRPRAVPAPQDSPSDPFGKSTPSGSTNGADPPRGDEPEDEDFDDDHVTDAQAAKRHRGQARMAYRLSLRYKNRLMHVHGIGWHYWDGKRWAEDQEGKAKQAVLDVLRRALTESFDSTTLSDDAKKALRLDVHKCESAGGINGVLNIASALRTFAATVDRLDEDPYLLNCANGTLDLRTMELRPHNPADRITKITRAAFDPTAESALWEQFLVRILPNEAVRGFAQRYLGSSLCGRVQEHKLAIFTGEGRNGKGVLYGACVFALGDYADAAEPDLFAHREGAHPTGEMDLLGRRLVVVSENDKNMRLGEAKVKKLTGGDRIKARRMRQDFVSFEPSHTPVLVTNYLPKVSGDDPALWARLRVVPFEVVIPEHEQDKHLGEKLELEDTAVLTYLIQGWAIYQAIGLAEPNEVKVATEKYQKSSNVVKRFVDDCCLVNPYHHVTVADLWERWCAWIREDGGDQLAKRSLMDALDRMGFPEKKGTHGVRLRKGLTLQAEEADEEAENA